VKLPAATAVSTMSLSAAEPPDPPAPPEDVPPVPTEVPPDPTIAPPLPPLPGLSLLELHPAAPASRDVAPSIAVHAATLTIEARRSMEVCLSVLTFLVRRPPEYAAFGSRNAAGAPAVTAEPREALDRVCLLTASDHVSAVIITGC